MSNGENEMKKIEDYEMPKKHAVRLDELSLPFWSSKFPSELLYQERKSLYLAYP
jgi:hypothetical protein